MENRYSIVCCSNFLNHYTLALSRELNKVFGKHYFIVGEELPDERKKLGFADLNDNEFVIRAYEDQEAARKAILEADIVLTGGYKYDKHIKERMKLGKPTFYDSERLFKNNSFIYHFLQFVWYNYKHRTDSKTFLMCISAYAAGDYNKIGLFKNRTFKWGYFSEAKEYDINKLMASKKKNSIVWAGRLIKWKHPEFCLDAAKKLIADGLDFEINIIGNGEMEEELKKGIEEEKLGSYVKMLGSMPPEKVRNYMEESEIYLFTSDRGEGWGVVLNEAMNSGCAVVASYSTGSVPFVVKDKQNGLIYKNDNVDDFYSQLKYLLSNKKETERIGRNAYESITNMWNPKVAAERLYKFTDAYLNGEDVNNLFSDDILSKARPVE